MLVTGPEEFIRETVVDVLCNKCGKSTKRPCDYECAVLSCSWGWDSKKDGECYESHLCESCYDEFVATFKIPVTYARP